MDYRPATYRLCTLTWPASTAGPTRYRAIVQKHFVFKIDMQVTLCLTVERMLR